MVLTSPTWIDLPSINQSNYIPYYRPTMALNSKESVSQTMWTLSLVTYRESGLCRNFLRCSIKEFDPKSK